MAPWYSQGGDLVTGGKKGVTTIGCMAIGVATVGTGCVPMGGAT